MLENAEATLPFSTSSFTTVSNVEITYYGYLQKMSRFKVLPRE